MLKLVECVPNFSEGSDLRVVNQIADAARSVRDVRVLDIHRDADHHRSVITFTGPPERIVEAAVLSVGEAARLIDLTRHQGVHPRIGAVDVVPFVPLGNGTIRECVELAHGAGKEIWERYRIPVYFYGAAAARPERRRLENVRRGGFEVLRERIAADPARKPDVGDAQLHPTAGATAVGAREILIAFNVNLHSGDVEVARAIARTVRESSGGLPAVKAMGVVLRSRVYGGSMGQAQVSMNLTDWRKTSIRDAYAAVEREAARRGVEVDSSEIVGLAPEGALGEAAPEALRLIGFGPGKILENRLKEFWGETR